MSLRRVAIAGLGLQMACSPVAAPTLGHDEDHAARAGGIATVFDASVQAFAQPIASLTADELSHFFVGNSFFNQNWISAPASVTTRDGLGPLFNARSCSGCHFRDGRGRPPLAGQALQSMLVRISPAADPRVPYSPHNAARSDSSYGDQIQDKGLPGVAPEAQLEITESDIHGSFADGEPYTLHQPYYRLTDWGYGEPQQALALSPRVAPHLIGLGLLESIEDAWLLRFEDPLDRDHDGISGRANRVWDHHAQVYRRGRFGWKAEQPSLMAQSAAAFRGDLGLSTAIFPTQNTAPAQRELATWPTGGSPEVDDTVLEAVTFYVQSIAVPARRDPHAPVVLRGQELFAQAGCATCHVPDAPISLPHASGSSTDDIVHPYTDLLLHDLGEALSDQRAVGEANGQEWRTPPLWGLGLVATVNGHTRLLHDGRARDFKEAILWHAGEAMAARERFLHFSTADRDALVAFLADL